MVTFAGLFCFASLALSQSIPTSGPASFKELFQGLATGIGELVAGIGTIMLVVAGILYVTSAGSTEQVGKAKKTLLWAIAGMAIGLAASAIVSFVANIAGS